jgi:hypothetical protein
MLYMGLTWIIMPRLIGVFVYLIAARRHVNSQNTGR